MTDELRRLERIPVVILEDHAAIDREVAGRIAALVRERAAEGRTAVLGLATGSTPLGVYRELVRLHREEGLSLANVVTFNLDEYYPMPPDSVHSYRRYMRENLFDHVDVPDAHVHVPRGDVEPGEVDAWCEEYEVGIREAGGIDLQLLGIGRSGHVGFNEPGSSRHSRTRSVWLDGVTRADAAADFFGEENVPAEAITMGVATILEAREVVLIATGEHKAQIVQRAVEGPVHPDVAATFLQDHADAVLYLDPAAAALLTRVRAPWTVGDVDWTPSLETEAVLWLAGRTGKPILHLAAGDYREHHLSALVSRHGSAGELNGRVFNELIAKIRGRSKLPAGERIVVFSPHPDDDVISMGGVLRKLVENGNDVVVAYQTSGNIAVFDHEVRRYLDFVRRAAPTLGLGGAATGRRPTRGAAGLAPTAGLARRLAELEAFLDARAPGEVDVDDVQDLKRVVRETEAIAGLRATGLSESAARFLDLPFYRTGAVKKDPIGEEDVRLVGELLAETRPTIVFAAGDLSDPHGTHRMCLETVLAALRRYAGPEPELWLYRGAWQEWPVSEATVLVPLSEAELRAKMLAIFRHQSQKDVAPFPGPDPREFWQRVRERNRATAESLRTLGLPAYYAMEAYVTLRGGERIRNPLIPTAALGEDPNPRERAP